MAKHAVLAEAPRIEPDEASQFEYAQVAEALDEALPLNMVISAGDVKLVLEVKGRALPLPLELAQVLHYAAALAANGRVVTLLPSETQLSPKEAADILGLSRTFLLRLVDEGAIHAKRLPGSTHRVLNLSDVLEFRAARERNREGMRRMQDIADEFELD